MEQGLKKKFIRRAKTLVWWDLNTCPVPDGFDPSRVRPSLETALKRYNYRGGPVTIFALGNLENICPKLLKALSSSGILLRHSPYTGGTKLFDVLFECDPSLSDVMLISGSKSWCSHAFLRFGYSLSRAFPNDLPASINYSRSYDWETLLKDFSSPPVDGNSQIVMSEDGPAWSCRLCKTPIQSFDDFINHLSSSQHTLNPSISALNPSISPELFWLGTIDQHWLQFLDCNSLEKNMYDEPLVCCRLCNYSSYDLHNMVIHFYSEEHAQNELALEIPNVTKPCEGFVNKFYSSGPKTTGVWWDLNTCPVPDGYDVSCVRSSIESALKKHFGVGPVTIFAVGNLDHASYQLLKDISSSGILLRHSPFGGGTEVLDFLHDWKDHNPAPTNIMIISGNETWYTNIYLHCRFTILRAFSECQPPNSLLHYGSYKEWVWESLLKENLGTPAETHSQIHKEKLIEMGEAAFYCKLCMKPSQNFNKFIKHLKSRAHKDEIWDWIRVDKNGKTEHYCEVCKYPSRDQVNMTAHKKSEGHKQKEQKVLKQELVLMQKELVLKQKELVLMQKELVLKQKELASSGVPRNLVVAK